MRSILVAAALAALALPARAADPKFEYGKQEEVKKTEWKLSAQLGLLFTTGNSQTTTFSGGANASSKRGSDKFQLELAGAYATSDILLAVDANTNGAVDPGEFQRVDTTTAKNYGAKARYDRFFTAHNSGFVSGRAGVDEPAGKSLIAGAQLGYSRQIVKDDKHELLGEAGYDFSYEDFLADVDPLAIHSARLFAGYTLTVSKITAVLASVEMLSNLNPEENPIAGEEDIALLEDTRITGKLAFSTVVWEKVSLRFSFTAKFDNAPAPLAPFPGIPFAMGFVPLAEELDTATELALIVNFL